MKNLNVPTSTWLACLAFMAIAPLSAGTLSPSSSLPPTNGFYVANVDACYVLPGPITACIQNGSDGSFQNPVSDFVTSPGNQISDFDSTLTGALTVNGSFFAAFSLQGHAQVEIFNRTSQSDLGTFNTEMLLFDMNGNVPGLGSMMIRESPTLASTGQTSVTSVPATRALFQIDSFFDIFTELSTDGGQTWIPQSNGPTRVALQAAPEPGSWLLLSTSLAGLAAFRLRRRV